MQKAMIVGLLMFGILSDASAKDPLLFVEEFDRIALAVSHISSFDSTNSFSKRINMVAISPSELDGTEPPPSARKAESDTGSVIHAGAAAQTASQLTLYGLIDPYITHSRNREGIPTTTYGIWKGSRLGLKGSQALGGGLKALFHLESGFGINDGKFRFMQDELFGRQAYLGLESGLGTVTFGRQYPVSDAVAGIAEIAWPGSTLSAYKSQFYWQIDRLENALLYASPKMGGFQACLGYAFAEKAGAAGTSTVTTGLLYSAGELTAGVALESWETSAFSTSSSAYNFWNLAASYDFGVAALVAAYSSDDVNLDLSSTTALKSKTYAVGATLPAGIAGRVVFLFQLTNPEKGSAMDLTSLRYTHTLSKSTAVYSQITLANNPAAAAYGRKSEFLLGVHHKFDVSFRGN